jgi:hypothetical protein
MLASILIAYVALAPAMDLKPVQRRPSPSGYLSTQGEEFPSAISVSRMCCHCLSGLGQRLRRPITTPSILGTWICTNAIASRTTWTFGADGRCVETVAFQCYDGGLRRRTEGTYRMVGRILTILENGQQSRFNVRLDGSNRMTLVHLDTGHQTHWVRER